MGQCFPGTDWSQKPREVKMVWLWRKAWLWTELRGEALKQGCVNDLFSVLLKHPSCPSSSLLKKFKRWQPPWTSHLNSMGKRSYLSIPRTIVPGCLQRLKLERASNLLCSVELGVVKGFSPPVHSSNTYANNYGKSMVSAQSGLGLA